MQTPTTAELYAAIKVLKSLGERINSAAFHSKLQMSESSLRNHHTAQIEVKIIERNILVEIVIKQLQNWRDEFGGKVFLNPFVRGHALPLNKVRFLRFANVASTVDGTKRIRVTCNCCTLCCVKRCITIAFITHESIALLLISL